MARYIDVEKLNYTKVSVYWGKDNRGRDVYRNCFVAFESDIDNMPTADVVPKNELEAEHNRWLKLVNENNMLENKLYWARQEVARGIFEEIDKHLFSISPIWDLEGWARIRLDDFTRLKKKYTEEERYEEIHSDRLCR